MNTTKQHITLFFVSLFFLVKVAGLHVFTHDVDASDVQHCEICLVETALNFTPLIEGDNPVLPEATYYFSEIERISLTPYIESKGSYLGSYHSTRPPPYFL